MSPRCPPLLALWLLCAACNVGEPLVGEKKFGSDDNVHGLCGRPPRCDDPWSAQPPPDHPAQPLYGCTHPRPCSGDSGELGLAGCPREKLDTLPPRAACKELELAAAKDADHVTLDALDWDEVNLTLRSQQPITVLLTGGTLSRVHMQLEGPVALRIEHVDTLSDLRVEGAANSGGTPSLSLDGLEGKQLSVGGAEQPFPGAVNLHALQLSDIDVRAASCNFESVTLDQASLRLDALVFTDVTLKHALLTASSAIASVYTIEDSTLRFCGDVRLIDGDISRSQLSSCLEQPLRMYASTFNSGMIDGAFELDDVSISNSRVASTDTTRMLAYNTRFFTAQLCDKLELIGLGIGSTFRCSKCYDGIADDDPVCQLETFKESSLSGNYCIAWQNLDQPALCSGDLPTRPNRLR